MRLNCIFYVIFRIFLWLSIWHNCPKPNSSYTKNYRRSALTNSKTTKNCCLSNSNKIKPHWSLYRTRLPLKLTQFFLDWLTFLYVLYIFLWNRGLKVNKIRVERSFRVLFKALKRLISHFSIELLKLFCIYFYSELYENLTTNGLWNSSAIYHHAFMIE